MPTVLIIANQTLAGDPLRAEITRRHAAAPTQFHVVVPATAVSHRLTWDEREALDLARARLDEALSWLRHHGIEATGEVGDHDPVQSARDALRTVPADEIILSTLPVGLSRWIGQDVPSRLRGAIPLPITVVTQSKVATTA